MRRLGQTTLTDEEKFSECKRHVEYLLGHLQELTAWELEFVSYQSGKIKQWGTRATFSNQELFKLRDLNERY